MARKRPSTPQIRRNLSGSIPARGTRMTAKQALGYSWDELNNMNESQIREVAAGLQKQANRTAERLRQRQDKNPDATKSAALRVFDKAGGNISIRGKNRNELLSEIARAKQFLGSQTSSVAGINKWKQNVGRAIERVTGKTFQEMGWGKDEQNAFWDLYTELIDDGVHETHHWSSDMLIQEVKRVTDSNSLNMTAKQFKAIIKKEKEEEARREQEEQEARRNAIRRGLSIGQNTV